MRDAALDLVAAFDEESEEAVVQHWQFGARVEADEPLTKATDYLWGENRYRLGHARAEMVGHTPRHGKIIRPQPIYRYTVAPGHTAYEVIGPDGERIDTTKTPRELGWQGRLVRVRIRPAH